MTPLPGLRDAVGVAGPTCVLLDALTFAEGPRWRDGKLWFSEMHRERVMTVDLAGRSEVVAEVPGRPSGLGWDPEGRLLMVSMTDRRLLRLDAGGLTEVADLSPLASFHCNDMVVDARGRAYVGHFGSDYEHEPPKPAELICVEPDGAARVVARDLRFPNGLVLTPDGRTLIAAESFAGCLTAFDVAEDGSLGQRRLWAQLPAGAYPDGICLDAEGAIWAAATVARAVLRMREGGEVVDRVPTPGLAIACMLGGPDGKTLFLCSAESSVRDECRAKATARIEIARAEVPHAGLP